MFELLLLTAITWLAYWGALKNGFVSDDIDAICNYEGEFRGWDYGNITKWIFYKLFQKDPWRNHFFSILMHNANTILLYLLLTNFFSIEISLYTSILFSIHPLGTQAIAWISARGYPIGLFWMLLAFNLVQMFSPMSVLFTGNILAFCAVTILFSLIYFLGVHAQFAVMMTFPIYIFLGNYYPALIGLVISSVMSLDIVRETIGIRAKVFKQQAMGESTKFTPSRLVIVAKSAWYYVQMCFFPKRMGLYHVYGYHYSPEMLKQDHMFWKGIITLSVLGAGLIWGPFLVKFAIIWFLSYIFIFLNWITIHQFVSERYCYIPSIAVCLVTAAVLVHVPVIFAFVVGVLIMRTWARLPTYEDEVPFYQSNIWNFPQSEVAFTNLGVTYVKRGLIGSAMDMWLISLKINADYDVAHYNISSTLKTQGQLKQSFEHLKKAVECPSCHFKEIWTKELEALEHEIQYKEAVDGLYKGLSEIKDDNKFKPQADAIKKKLEELQTIHKQIEESQKKQVQVMQQKEKELQSQLIDVQKGQDDLKKPIPIEELVKLRDNQFNALVNEFSQIMDNNKEEKKDEIT